MPEMHPRRLATKVRRRRNALWPSPKSYHGPVRRLLYQLPPVVKLDKALIDDLITSETQRSIVRGIAMIVKNLNMKVIAEGVETTQQANILMDENLYVHQGYLNAKPMRPEEIVVQFSKIGADVVIGESAEKDPDIL